MIKKLSLVIVVILLSLPTRLFAVTLESVYKSGSDLDGNAWQILSKAGESGKAAKLNWVVGYSSGSFEMTWEGLTFILCVETVSADSDDKIRSEIKKPIEKALNHFGRMMERGGGNYEQVIEVIDKFYKDPLNRNILLSGAYWIAELSLQGAPRDFIDQQTRLLIMSEEKRITEFETLIKEDPKYKKAFKEWGFKVPVWMFGCTAEQVKQFLQE